MTIVEPLLFMLALALLAASAFLALEVAASFTVRRTPTPTETRGRIGVVIPAHNEGDGVAATVAAVRKQLTDVDRIIVVADNCTDDTADQARPAGAVAIERNDLARCGKGYALQFGVDHLRGDPPDTVIFVDADCRPADGALRRIAALASRMNRPVQALYLMTPPLNAGPKVAVSAFAWLLMNRVRMSGLQAIAGVTRLTGAGMALPWEIVSKRNLASGEIVEDLALTIAMIEAGAPPFLDIRAVVESDLAATDRGATTQRARWEHGSLRIARRAAPKLFLRGLRGDFASLAMAFDIAIPPLTVFAALHVVMLTLTVVAAFAGASGPFTLTIWSGVLFAASILVAWRFYGREVLPVKALAAIWPYVAGKLRVYGAEGRDSARRWTRTDRGADQ